MRPLVSAAVLGVVPLPPLPDAGPNSDEDRRMTAADANAPQFLRLPVSVAERMATKDELARIRDALEDTRT